MFFTLRSNHWNPFFYRAACTSSSTAGIDLTFSEITAGNATNSVLGATGATGPATAAGAGVGSSREAVASSFTAFVRSAESSAALNPYFVGNFMEPELDSSGGACQFPDLPNYSSPFMDLERNLALFLGKTDHMLTPHVMLYFVLFC